ncbi:MAG: CinA family protein, partial [Zoogloeaceae bacterium]|nr:CinA family protein [Zoogloeaceae bacterium]
MAADVTPEILATLARRIGETLRAGGKMLATAESCTGGGVAHVLTALPGASEWFERGFVAYSNAAKMEMLGVRAAVLAQWGAVSEATAQEMAQGALRHSRAHWSLAITGIAGPGGGTPEQPVGTVCLAWGERLAPENFRVKARTRHFSG